ncbi:uncharacterized protein [Prorops nasuta]|uniref:uncharacterized protein n=1 Tax=Prorops nasuta TaxID=863751 RepID=UPI0034D018E9
MADESQAAPTTKRGSVLGSQPILFKIVEVGLAVFAIGLMVDPFNSFQQVFNRPRVKLDDIAIIYITIAGYIIINSLFIIAHFLGDRIPKRTVILFASLGAILHVVSGSVMIHNWRKVHGPFFHISNNELYPSKQYMDMLISSAVFIYVNALVFIVEIFINAKYA